MHVVRLRATFFMASSSSLPQKHWHLCHMQSRWHLWGAREEVRVHMGDRIYGKEGGGWTSNSFTSLQVVDKNGLAELKCGGESPQCPGEGTVPTSHPASAASRHCVLPSLPATPNPCSLTPGWTAEGTWWQQLRLLRERDQEPEKQTEEKKRRQLAMVSHLRCSIRCLLAARWETRAPGMGVVQQKRRRFFLHAKNASLTAQLSSPHQHYLMIILSDHTAKKYLALVIPTH